MKEQEFCIFAFYQFKTTTNKLQLQKNLNRLSKKEKIKGIVLIADEGINGTVSGFIDGIKKLEKYLEKEGFPPISIKGTKLKGGYLEIDGNISSQMISALILIASEYINPIKLLS